MANTKITDNPLFQRLPQTDREFRFFAQTLADFLIMDVIPGAIASQRVLPMVRVGNRGSVQSIPTLTSADEGATADITIAAHSLIDETGAIAYNGGSITGLAFNTTYYVYADDADYEGGAVTYIATTTQQDLVGDAGRYYVGAIVTAALGDPTPTGGGGGGGAGGGLDPAPDDGELWP